jgi:hypothetical protein
MNNKGFEINSGIFCPDRPFPAGPGIRVVNFQIPDQHTGMDGNFRYRGIRSFFRSADRGGRVLFIAVLIGLFMVLWGIFFNGWDWLLIGAGLAVALIAGWYTYREIVRTGTG